MSSHENENGRVESRRSVFGSMAAGIAGVTAGMLLAPREAQARISLTDLQDQINDLEAELSLMKEQTSVFWSGYSTSHGRQPGSELRYPLDGVLVDDAGDYLEVNPNGTVTVRRAGRYRINFSCISRYTGAGWARMRINGDSTRSTEVDNRSSNEEWRSLSIDSTHDLREGDSFEIAVFNFGSYNFHRGPNWSGLQVTFVAPT